MPTFSEGSVSPENGVLTNTLDSSVPPIEKLQEEPPVKHDFLEESKQLDVSSDKKESIQQASLLTRALVAAKYAVHSAVVIGEISPTNEAIRYGALAATLTQTTNPLLGAVVLGGSTALVEGSAALSTSQLLASHGGSKAIKITNRLLGHPFVERFLPSSTKMSPVVEAGVAMTAGSSIVTMLKQREDPSRTLSQNRRYGIFTAGWMGSVFALEGAAISKGVEGYHDPKTIGAALIALGGIHAATVWAKNKMNREVAYKEVSVVGNNEIDQSSIPRSVEAYTNYRKIHDEEVKVGLYGQDLEAAFHAEGAQFIKYSRQGNEENFYMPLLVPVEQLEWYNHDYLAEKYGKDTQVYYFAHPSIPRESKYREPIIKAIKQLLDEGTVVITDTYITDDTFQSIVEELNTDEEPPQYELGYVGSTSEKRAEVYVGEMIVEGRSENNNYQNMGLLETYKTALQNGEIESAGENGTSIEEEISDEDIEQCWRYYSEQFDLLAEGHPTLAGFDEAMFRDILKDPAHIKLIHRNHGKIVSLAVVEEGLRLSPWFSRDKYQTKFPDYAEEQILTWPIIVSDPEAKVGVSSLKLFELTGRVICLRGKNVIITSECTETSGRYIPKLVRRAAGNLPIVDFIDMKNPVSVTEYKSIRKI